MNMRTTTRAFGLPAACLLLAGGATAATETPERLAVQATSVLRADGSVLSDGIVLIENGRILKVGQGEMPADWPQVHHDGFLSAGLTVCHTYSGAAGEVHDPTRTLIPRARLAHAFDPEHGDFARALSAGITTVVLAPNAQNVAGGLTVVVKTAGGVVVREDAHLAISLSSHALVAQGSTRNPTSYSGAVRLLTEHFSRPDGPFSQASMGAMPVMIDAWSRHEVARAVGLARRFGLKGAIRGGVLVGEQADLIAAAGLSVVLDLVGPGGATISRRRLDSMVALAKAGIPFAFALDQPEIPAESLRLTASMAIGAGLDRGVAWRALTSDAAAIAGAADRVGKLERGMDADFVLWSGHPLDLASRVERVYIDGQARGHNQ